MVSRQNLECVLSELTIQKMKKLNKSLDVIPALAGNRFGISLYPFPNMPRMKTVVIRPP
jgi:hypothetical protein